MPPALLSTLKGQSSFGANLRELSVNRPEMGVDRKGTDDRVAQGWTAGDATRAASGRSSSPTRRRQLW
jgi:hypothetical protein